MVSRTARVVGKYRENPGHDDYVIGCRILVQPVFLPERLWIPQPRSWARSIVVGKTDSTEDREGRQLWERVMALGSEMLAARGFAESQIRYGEPTLVKPRLGQGAFRIAVTDAYNRTCACQAAKCCWRWTRRTSNLMR